MSELNLHPPSITFWQRRIVIMGWITYATYYLVFVTLAITAGLTALFLAVFAL